MEHDDWLWHLELNCHIHFKINSRSGQSQNSPKPGNEIFFAILELSFGIFTKGTRPQCIENSKSGPTAFDLYVDPVLSIAILIWIICLEHRLEDKMVRFGLSCTLQHLHSSVYCNMKCRDLKCLFLTLYLLKLLDNNWLFQVITLNLGLFMSCSTPFFPRLT